MRRGDRNFFLRFGIRVGNTFETTMTDFLTQEEYFEAIPEAVRKFYLKLLQ